MKKARLAILAVCASLMSGVANASPLTCSGKLWNIWKDEHGETWIEIGNGIYQCSVKNTASKAAKKILSVCTLGSWCAVRVDIMPRTDGEMSEQDGVVITARDKVLWVRGHRYGRIHQ